MLIGGGLIATLHMNPTPIKNESGKYFMLTARQVERTVVHIQIDRDGENKPEGLWQISGHSMAALQQVQAIDAAQRQTLSDKLQCVMSPMGWV